MHHPPIVVQTESLHPAAAAWLAERCDVRVVALEDPALPAALAEARGLVIRTYTRVDDALLAAAPRLEVVGRAGVGLDQVDIAACRRGGVEVVHTPDANTQAVVEYVFRILLGAVRSLHPLIGVLEPAAWRAARMESSGRRQLDECTLGILGLGRIGRRVAEVARAFGMPVRYCDLLAIPNPPPGAEAVGVQELFATSDIVTLHVDGRPSNRRFVDAHLIAGLRPEVIFVNAARGFVVDHAALARFLAAHPAAEAHLDVHDPEPITRDHPLLDCANAHLYPHLAARTEHAMEAMSWVVRDVVAVLEGRAPAHPAPPVSE